ncbi:MAG: F0F1 ATP synthase subunit B [Parcubacteria group bacterium]|nr:F0F1 ATP synthase subunit B [Parcubacteria group bacterium]MCR4342860.1 F0F1 ATP synthase subunit B [Patescibacteria group bacterium]
MELLKAFGVNYKILIAQLLNFAVLFFVLYKLGYKPIFKFLEDRKDRIKNGLEMADKAETRLNEAEEEKKAIIINSKKEASDIISKADKLAREKKDEMISKAKEEIRLAVDQEKERMKGERNQIVREIKNEITDLIAIAVEKIMEEKVDIRQDKAIIDKVINSK